MRNASLIELAGKTGFFRGMSPEEIDRLLFRFNGVKKSYRKGEVIVHAGMTAARLMIVVSGHLHVYQRVMDDREILVREITKDTVLGLWMLNSPEIENWPATVVVAEPCVTISLDMARVRRFLESGEPEVARIAVNVSCLLSRELFSIWRKLSVLSEQNLVDRIQMYLSELHHESGDSGMVAVPFNREKMAEFFGVTRPALSRALGQMRDRGLISWRKNTFRVMF